MEGSVEGYDLHMDIRGVVIDALADQRRSRHWLARRMSDAGICSESTVYRWLRGEGDIGASIAGEALSICGVTIGTRSEVWGTVRTPDGVAVCRVGGALWMRSSYRVAVGTRESAEISRSQRLQGLTRAGRLDNCGSTNGLGSPSTPTTRCRAG